MARAKGKRVNVCGVNVLVTGINQYGGGHIAPTARYLGQYGSIGKASAKKLVDRFGFRLPRPGYEMKLCDGIKLGNKSGRFELVTDPHMLGQARRRRR